MAVTNGTSVLLEVGGVTINGTTSHDMSIITDMIDITTKDSSGSKEYIAGEDDGTISVEGKYDPAATYGFSQLFAAQLAKASATLTFGLQASSSKAYRMAGLIMSLTLSGPQNEAGTWTVELQKTGGVAEVTIT
jgi:predicted secreted protein